MKEQSSLQGPFPMRTSPDAVFPNHFYSASKLLLSLGIVLATLLACPCDLWSQDGSTSLQGIIEDSSGARIAAASITVSDAIRGLRLHDGRPMAREASTSPCFLPAATM